MIKKLTAVALILLIGSSFCAAEPVSTGKDSKQETGKTKPAARSDRNAQAGWLNRKNFPSMQDGPCPFYVQPGC